MSFSTPAPLAAVAQPDIHVSSCQVMSGLTNMPRTDDIGVAVRFLYHGAEPLSEIVWRVKYGATSVDAFDDGTFSPDLRIDNYVLAEQGSTHVNVGAVIKDVLLLAVHAAPSGDVMKSTRTLPLYAGLPNPENCAIVRVAYASGAIWTNPDIDQTPHMLPPPTPAPAAALADVFSSGGPIEIAHCLLTVQGPSDLQVTFRNSGSIAADRIVFRAAYGSSGMDFTDLGSFAGGVLIKHGLRGTRTDVRQRQPYLAFDDPRSCTVVSVHYADGSSWQNPAASATPGPLPTPVPEAIPLSAVALRWAPRHNFPTPLPGATTAP